MGVSLVYTEVVWAQKGGPCRLALGAFWLEAPGLGKRVIGAAGGGLESRAVSSREDLARRKPGASLGEPGSQRYGF